MIQDHIVNGSFEDGLSNWDLLGGQAEDKDHVTNDSEHNGTYGLKMRGGGNNEIGQTLASPVKVSKMITFGLWVRNFDEHPMSIYITVTYTDNTTKGMAPWWWSDWGDTDWYYLDILAELDTTKTVKSFMWNITGIDSYYACVDDVELTAKASPPIPSIFVRAKSCTIGKDENNTYEWLGLKKLTFGDVDPWVHIEIPDGPMLHHHLRSVHVEGEIVVNDLGALYEALFETEINSNNDTAIHPSTGRKYSVEYILFTVVNQEGTEYDIIFDGFKVKTVGVGAIELGTEAIWIVTFTADRVSYP